MDNFTSAYIEAAFWTSEAPGVSTEEWQATNEHDEGSIPGDVGLSDLAPEALEMIIKDCEAFQHDNSEMLNTAYDTEGYGYTDQSGHDFWLTRNGHGAGFWDRPAIDGPIGKALSDAARKCGSRDLYLGDDGQVYYL